MAHANLALIYEDVAARGVVSGGGWQPGSLRLSNLLTPYLAEIARSNSTAPSDTHFTIDLGVYSPIAGIALGNCGVTPFARYRIRAFVSDEASPTIYDTGEIGFPVTRIDGSLLAWEDPGLWEGVTQEFDDRRKGSLLLHFLAEPVVARVWRIEIIDPNNANGHLDIARLIMGRLWQPEINDTYGGNSLEFNALTDVEESRSGTRFYNARNIRRVFSFSYDYLPEDTAYRDIYRIATVSGISNQVVVVPNPADVSAVQREAFIGTLGTPPSLRRPVFGCASTSFKVEEVL